MNQQCHGKQKISIQNSFTSKGLNPEQTENIQMDSLFYKILLRTFFKTKNVTSKKTKPIQIVLTMYLQILGFQTKIT